MASTLTYNGRLPGVVCQTSLPPQRDDPLRLDVAAFVGFAQRGPLDTPVAVEDISQYRLLYGGDLLVARDGGRPVYAHLPTAVQSFFDNGGRRCYVVRVAGDDARPNRFRLPGLVSWSALEGYRAVAAPAAWAGGWSDGMTVATQLLATPLAVSPLMSAALPPELGLPPGLHLLLELPADLALQPGDLLRLQVDGPAGQKLLLLAPLQSLRVLSQALPGIGAVTTLVTANPAVARTFQATNPAPLPRAVEAERLTEDGWQPLAVDVDLRPLAGRPSALLASLPAASAVAPGDLLRVLCDDNSVLLFAVQQVGHGQEQLSPPAGSRLEAVTDDPLWQRATAAEIPAGQLRQVDLLTVELMIGEGDEAAERWSELRFAAGADHWSGVLALNGDHQAAGAVQVSSGRSLRLGTPADLHAEPGRVYLPLGMADLLDPELAARPLPDAATSGKDGLDVFDPGALFLDDRLRGVGRRALMAEAEHLLYLTEQPTVLRKLHGVLPLDEVGQVAIPDLAHRPWQPAPPPPAAPVPSPEPDEPPDWSRFQQCPTPLPDEPLEPDAVVQAFLLAVQRHDLAAARDTLSPAMQARLDNEPLLSLLGIGALPVSFQVDPPPCDPGSELEATVRALLHLGNGVDVALLFGLLWNGVMWRIDAIEAQISSLSAGQQLTGLPQVIDPAQFRSDPAALDALLEMHCALANLCAARADLVAVLSLPEHFERPDVLDWQRRLHQPLHDCDTAALSYAAVYHPWVQVREENTPELALRRHLPPDGAACGVIAARELARGVWIAPANVPLRGVVGLSPDLPGADLPALFDAQVNLLHQQPGFFSQWSAHTLATDRLLVQLNVRRLLIYLRKLALRRGMDYVFEPNDERFRRRVQGGFERVLRQLAQRGALQAYEVVTGDGLNTPYDLDQGRFIIALKVAPTLPVEFITVALLRSGEDLLQVVEF